MIPGLVSMKDAIRKIVSLLPEGRKESLVRIHGTLRGVLYAGSSFECPCCGSSFRKMIKWDPSDPEDKNRVCPKCRAQSRHRLLHTYLSRETSLFKKSTRLLHFAPEPFFFRMFKEASNIDYVPVDLMMSEASVQLDITSIPFKDGAFDAIMCNHVL